MILHKAKLFYVAQSLITFLCLDGYAYANSLSNITAEADRGSPSAEFLVGERYLNVRMPNKPEFYGCRYALRMFNMSAEKGYVKSEMMLASIDARGYQCTPISPPISKIIDESQYWFEKAADSGDLVADADLCEILTTPHLFHGKIIEKPQYKTAYKWCERLRKYGYSNIYGLTGNYGTAKIYYAEHNIAMATGLFKAVAASYDVSLTGKQPKLIDDLVKSSKQYLGNIYYNNKTKYGANKGDPRDEYDVGLALAKGYGVKKNYAYAIYFWQKAAEKGYSPAENKLGDAFKNGVGVNQSSKRAFQYYTLAAKNGFAKAEYHLAKMYAGYSSVVKDSHRMYAYWMYKAAIQGYPKAEYAYGNTYDYYGFQTNYKIADEWWKAAAKNGYAKAQDSLGNAYLSGKGVSLNTVKALKWFTKSADLGDRSAAVSVQELENGSLNGSV